MGYVQNLGAAKGKMSCLGKKRKSLTPVLTSRDKCELAFRMRNSLAGSVFVLAAWMIFLTSGLGWAARCSSVPCSDHVGSARESVAWYQARHTASGDQAGYPGNAVAGPVVPQPQREHLGEWLRQHQNMPFPEQERALRTESGFNRLPPAKQQRLLERLQQLDAMPPRRNRLISTPDANECWSGWKLGRGCPRNSGNRFASEYSKCTRCRLTGKS